MVVVELTGKEERLGEAVALGGVMTIMVMGRNEVMPEASIRLEFDWKRVVVPEKHTLGVTCHLELRREGAVEGSESLVILLWEERMEFAQDTVCRSVENSSARI